MKTYHTFKNEDTFQKYLRTKHGACAAAGKHGGCVDYVRVAGVLYTMHEFDSAGRTITWANKKRNMMMEMTTTDRYADHGYDDAVIDIYPASYLRTDISYAE